MAVIINDKDKCSSLLFCNLIQRISPAWMEKWFDCFSKWHFILILNSKRPDAWWKVNFQCHLLIRLVQSCGGEALVGSRRDVMPQIQLVKQSFQNVFSPKPPFRKVLHQAVFQNVHSSLLSSLLRFNPPPPPPPPNSFCWSCGYGVDSSSFTI